MNRKLEERNKKYEKKFKLNRIIALDLEIKNQEIDEKYVLQT